MKSTVVDQEGRVRCPKCGAADFVSKRTGKAKWAGVVTLGVGAAAMPKRLKCSGCGENLKRGDGRKDDAVDRMRSDLDAHKAAVEAAKLEQPGAPLPSFVHPKSIAAKRIEKAREKNAVR